MHVLLTGASGYVGAAILDRLVSSGCAVRVLALPETVERLVHRDRIEVVEGSLADGAILTRAVQGIEVVLHFAAALPSQATSDIIAINVRGTESLLEASVASGVRRFVVASTMAVYDPVLRRSRWPIREDSPLLAPGRRARSHYPQSKIDVENLVRRFHERTGLEYVIIRFPIVYGPGAPLVENYIQMVLSRPSLITSGASLAPGMQWIQARDLAAAADLARTRAEAANEVFNVAGGVLFSMRDMLECIAEQNGLALPPVRERGAILTAMSERLARAPGLKYDIGKAERLLGFRPQANLRESLKEIAADMARRGLLPDALPSEPPLGGRSMFQALAALVSSRSRRRTVV